MMEVDSKMEDNSSNEALVDFSDSLFLSSDTDSVIWNLRPGSQDSSFNLFNSLPQSSQESEVLICVNPHTLSQSQPVDFFPESTMEDDSLSSNDTEQNPEESCQTSDEQSSSDEESFELEWEGKYRFSHEIELQDDQRFSVERSMLFTKPSTDIHVNFMCDFKLVGSLKSSFELKCFLKFTDPVFQRLAVGRCKGHGDPASETNHSLLCTNSSAEDKTVYEGSTNDILYLRIPLGKPTPGMNHVIKLFQIQCKNSCYRSMLGKDRGLTCVFELIEGGRVVGRSAFYVEVRANPGRDFKNDEEKQKSLKSKVRKSKNFATNENSTAKKTKNKRENSTSEHQQRQKKKVLSEVGDGIDDTRFTNLTNLTSEDQGRLDKAREVMNLTNSTDPVLRYIGKTFGEDVDKVYSKVQDIKNGECL